MVSVNVLRVTTQEQPSTGGPPVEVRRSKRRRRTVQAYQRDDTVVVLLPARMTKAEERFWVQEMVGRLERQEERRQRRRNRTDAELLTRANDLSARYLDGRARPAEVRWVSNQNDRWGSCTPAQGSIRLSDRLRDVPAWVADYVLLHELAHLLEPGHGPEFWQWVNRYPRTERARGYLEGILAAAHLTTPDAPPTVPEAVLASGDPCTPAACEPDPAIAPAGLLDGAAEPTDLAGSEPGRADRLDGAAEPTDPGGSEPRRAAGPAGLLGDSAEPTDLGGREPGPVPGPADPFDGAAERTDRGGSEPGRAAGPAGLLDGAAEPTHPGGREPGPAIDPAPIRAAEGSRDPDQHHYGQPELPVATEASQWQPPSPDEPGQDALW